MKEKYKSSKCIKDLKDRQQRLMSKIHKPDALLIVKYCFILALFFLSTKKKHEKS